MKKFTTSFGVVALLLVGFSAPAHAWFFKTNVNADVGPKTYNNQRHDSHNMRNVKNSIIGTNNYNVGVGNRSDVGKVEGNKNYIDNSISGSSFSLGDDNRKTNNIGYFRNDNTTTNTSSGNER